MTPFPTTPGHRDLVIRQGATWIYQVTWQRPAGSPLDITGFTARMQIRSQPSAAEILAELTTENGRIAISGPAGLITLTLSDAVTAAFNFGGRPVYDLELIQASPRWVVSLIEGSITLQREVTR